MSKYSLTDELNDAGIDWSSASIESWTVQPSGVATTGTDGTIVFVQQEQEDRPSQIIITYRQTGVNLGDTNKNHVDLTKGDVNLPSEQTITVENGLNINKTGTPDYEIGTNVGNKIQWKIHVDHKSGDSLKNVIVTDENYNFDADGAGLKVYDASGTEISSTLYTISGNTLTFADSASVPTSADIVFWGAFTYDSEHPNSNYITNKANAKRDVEPVISPPVSTGDKGVNYYHNMTFNKKLSHVNQETGNIEWQFTLTANNGGNCTDDIYGYTIQDPAFASLTQAQINSMIGFNVYHREGDADTKKDDQQNLNGLGVVLTKNDDTTRSEDSALNKVMNFQARESVAQLSITPSTVSNGSTVTAVVHGPANKQFKWAICGNSSNGWSEEASAVASFDANGECTITQPVTHDLTNACVQIWWDETTENKTGNIQIVSATATSSGTGSSVKTVTKGETYTYDVPIDVQNNVNSIILTVGEVENIDLDIKIFNTDSQNAKDWDKSTCLNHVWAYMADGKLGASEWESNYNGSYAVTPSGDQEHYEINGMSYVWTWRKGDEEKPTIKRIVIYNKNSYDFKVKSITFELDDNTTYRKSLPRPPIVQAPETTTRTLRKTAPLRMSQPMPLEPDEDVGTITFSKVGATTKEMSSTIYRLNTAETSSGWEYTFTGLPACDASGVPYYYWIVEEQVNGSTAIDSYDISYSYKDGDNIAEDSDTAINGDATGVAEITIRNTPKTESSSTLPTSGGSGTAPYRTAGFLLMMTAVTFPYIKHRNRRKRNSA